MTADQNLNNASALNRLMGQSNFNSSLSVHSLVEDEVTGGKVRRGKREVRSSHDRAVRSSVERVATSSFDSWISSASLEHSKNFGGDVLS